MALAAMELKAGSTGGVRSAQRHSSGRAVRVMACLALVAGLAACSTTGTGRAPVEDRNVTGRTAAATSATPSASTSVPTDAAKPPPPGAENANKPGFYTVRPGDTLLRVGLETGQNWKDLVKWNNIENPNVLEVGQVLRVVPPGTDPGAVSTRGVTSAKVEARPLDAAPPKPVTTGSAPTAGAPTLPPPAVPPAVSPAAPPAATPPAATPPAAASGDDDLRWIWPANGAVVARFDEVRSKGVSIGGKAGDPVIAAADGKVVYAGSGLRGYGNLVILKHNNTYLTAYAHNQTLLVKEEQVVKRGQKIAEMGTTDTDRVKLHFEIRKLGKPVDPEKLLPAR